MRRPGSRQIPPPLELQCLKALWILGEGTVGEVRKALAGERELAYTTVMTLLERVARKGGLERRKAGRSFIYRPLLNREVLRNLAVKELIDGFFDGSPRDLLQFLEHGGAQRPTMADVLTSEPY